MPSSTRLRHIFGSSWEETTIAFWNKYPHPKLKHVKDCLVLSRDVDNDGILHTKRLICIEQKPPKLLEKLNFCCPINYAIETSTVDPKEKVLKISTQNLTFDSFVDAKEECIYQACSTDAGKTEYIWKLTVSEKNGIPFLGKRIEEALVNHADKNAEQGMSIIEHLIHSQRQFM